MMALGHLVDLALLVCLVEALWLAHRRRGALLLTLGAGALLMLALRLQLAEAAPPGVLACLVLSGLLHAVDMITRLSSARPPQSLTPTATSAERIPS